MFPPRSILKPLPQAFRNPMLREVRVVIDCTECFVESSSDLRQQGNLFSRYKHHTTVKALIGVAPSGSAMFISDGFEGAISDRDIFKQVRGIMVKQVFHLKLCLMRITFSPNSSTFWKREIQFWPTAVSLSKTSWRVKVSS